MATNTKLDSLVINYLTQSQYDTAKTNGKLNANQIYMTPASSTSYTLPTGNASTLGGVKLSDSTSSTSSTNGGIAATPKAVKDAYDASTEWVSLSVSSVYTVKSGITMWANTEKAHRRGRRVYLTFQCMGPATSDAAGFIQIGTVQSAYRPKVNTYCPFGLNVTTSGQIFGPAVCIVKTTGEIQVYTGKNDATFGNNSYGWTTNNPNTISWDY